VTLQQQPKLLSTTCCSPYPCLNSTIPCLLLSHGGCSTTLDSPAPHSRHSKHPACMLDLSMKMLISILLLGFCPCISQHPGPCSCPHPWPLIPCLDQALHAAATSLQQQVSGLVLSAAGRAEGVTGATRLPSHHIWTLANSGSRYNSVRWGLRHLQEIESAGKWGSSVHRGGWGGCWVHSGLGAQRVGNQHKHKAQAAVLSSSKQSTSIASTTCQLALPHFLMAWETADLSSLSLSCPDLSTSQLRSWREPRYL
jgi:hypothetical protein